MSQKTDDQRVVPLCTWCHRRFHDRGALPGMTRGATEHLFLRVQVDLLVEWLRLGMEKHGVADA